jgi:hypothetical protein
MFKSGYWYKWNYNIYRFRELNKLTDGKWKKCVFSNEIFALFNFCSWLGKTVLNILKNVNIHQKKKL